MYGRRGFLDKSGFFVKLAPIAQSSLRDEGQCRIGKLEIARWQQKTPPFAHSRRLGISKLPHLFDFQADSLLISTAAIDEGGISENCLTATGLAEPANFIGGRYSKLSISNGGRRISLHTSLQLQTVP